MIAPVRKTVALVLAAALLASCANATDVAKQTAVGTLGAISAASDAFSAYDMQRQEKCIDDAQSRDEAMACLEAWRTKKAAVRKAFALVYDAVLDLAKAIPLVEMGLAKEKDLSKWITQVLVEVDALKDTLADAGVPLGPLAILGSQPIGPAATAPSPAPQARPAPPATIRNPSLQLEL